MKKLNNKGITTIEVIICFVLIVIITMSMFSTISYFNEKRLLENYKEQIYSYKDLLTKDIQDDFIKIGLTHVEHKLELVPNPKISGDYNSVTRYTITCTMKDGSNRQLIVDQTYGRSSTHLAGLADRDDYFMIKYGKKSAGASDYEYVEYPLPELGTSTQNGLTIQDLSINNVSVNVNDKNNVLSIYIGLDHPELLKRYGINIVTPIDYVTDGGMENSTWEDLKS